MTLDPTRKLYGYCRVSTSEQADDSRSSLDTQRDAIQRLATYHGINDVELFADPGVSGSVALSERPGGAAMCAKLAPGSIVVASKLDRIFRSAVDALQTVEAWKAQGIDLILLDFGTEPVSANGAAKMFFTMAAAFAEFERSRIAERLADGRIGKKARSGAISGNAPYGFKKVGEGRNAILEPEPQEQAVAARIKALRAEGMSYRKLISALTSEGLYMRNGKEWTLQMLCNVMGSDRLA